MSDVDGASPADRCAGALLGLAAGDRNGGPIEMAVRLAESLIDEGSFDPDDVFGRYLAWHRDGAFDTGPVAMAVFRLCASGVSREEAVARVHEEFDGMTAGVNPAHRVAPLGMARSIDTADLSDAARSEASLTHAHRLAGDTAAAVALLVRHLIVGADIDDAIFLVADDRLPPVTEALREPAPRSVGGFSPDTLSAAVHFVLVGESFVDGLERSLAFAGPANYCPVLVGAIAGARWGADVIPPAQLAHVSDLERVQAAGHRLGGAW